MRCRFCHNPDSWAIGKGSEMTADELLDQAEHYRPYWGREGGITVSGGEPLLQIDFLIELFTKARQRGINTCLDTSAQPFTREEPWFSKWEQLMQVTDIILLDIKHIRNEEHRRLTGRGNENILDCAQYLSDTGKPVWIRHVLVPEITDKNEYLHELADFLKTKKNIERIDVLPYHTLGVFKYRNLGIPYSLEGVSTPTQDRVANAQRILEG